MKNLRNLALTLTFVLLMSFNAKAMAEGVGFIDYKKVQDNYAYAQAAAKEIDAKALELQQFVVDKEKQYKALDTPLKREDDWLLLFIFVEKSILLLLFALT